MKSLTSSSVNAKYQLSTVKRGGGGLKPPSISSTVISINLAASLSQILDWFRVEEFLAHRTSTVTNSIPGFTFYFKPLRDREEYIRYSVVGDALHITD